MRSETCAMEQSECQTTYPNPLSRTGAASTSTMSKRSVIGPTATGSVRAISKRRSTRRGIVHPPFGAICSAKGVEGGWLHLQCSGDLKIRSGCLDLSEDGASKVLSQSAQARPTSAAQPAPSRYHAVMEKAPGKGARRFLVNHSLRLQTLSIHPPVSWFQPGSD